MKKTVYNVISMVLIGVGVSLFLYPFIPIEAQEFITNTFPEFNEIVAMAVGGGSGALGGSLVIAKSIADKGKEDTLDIMHGLISKYEEVKEENKQLKETVVKNTFAIDYVAKQQSELTKELRKNNKLIETDLLIKKDNRFISKDAKELIDRVVNGDEV